MKKLLIPAILIAAAVALAACGGGGGSDVATAGTGMNAVAVKDIGGAGTVLVDSSGQALYAPDQEATGKILCTGACNSFWVPLTAHGTPTASGSLPGKLGVVKRPDGAMQVTYNGAPLYTFTQDQAGEVTGDGFKDAFGGQQFTWHVISVGSSGSTASSGGGSTSSSSGGGSGYSY
jgi:predicted lipoprotein with Yx(FWY)xxD motif